MAPLPRRLIRLGVVAAIVALLAAVALHAPFLRGRLFEFVRSYAERELGVELRSPDLRFSLLSRSIVLGPVSLKAVSRSEPFFEADGLVLVLTRRIWRGDVEIDRLSVTRPRVTLVRYADGNLNLPPTRKTTEAPAPLHLGVVSLAGLSLSFDDKAAGRMVSAGPIDLSIDTAGTPLQPGSFGPSAFAVRAGQIDLTGTFEGRLGFDGRRVQIDELLVQTPQGRVSVTGWADAIAARPAVSARVTAAVDLPQALHKAGVDAHDLSGQLTAVTDVSGELTAPAIAAAITSSDLTYRNLGPLAVTGRSAFTAGRITVDSLEVRSADGNLHARGVIALDETAGGNDAASEVNLRWSNLDIDALARLLDRPLPTRSDSLATGSATVGFRVGDLKSARLSRLRAKAETTLTAREPRAGTLGLAGRAGLQLEHGVWTLRHVLHASGPQADLEGTLSGRVQEGTDARRSSLAGRSTLRVGDVATLIPLLETAGTTVPAGTIDGGSLLAVLEPAGTLESPRAAVHVTVRDLRSRSLPTPVNATGRLDVDANGVGSQRIDASSGAAAARISGHYFWNGRYDATTTIEHGNLAELAAQTALPVALQGTASLDGSIAGRLAGGNASGTAKWTLAARDVVADDVRIGAVNGSGTVDLEAGGVATIVANAPDAGARAAIEIVNGPNYPVSGEVSIASQRIETLIPARYLPPFGDPSGRLTATARGAGSLSNPAGIRGRLEIRNLDLRLRGTRIALAAPALVTIAGDRLGADAVELRIGERLRATLRGELGAVASATPVTIRLEGPVAEWAIVASRAAGVAPVPVRAEGTALLDLTIAGTLDRPQPSGTLAVSSPSIEYGTLAPVTGVKIDAVVDPTAITLRAVAARWQDAVLEGEGLLPWRVLLDSISQAKPQGASRLAAWLATLPAEPSLARLILRADNVTHGVLAGFVSPGSLENIRGSASATLTAEASALTLERLRATAVLDRAAITLAGVPFTQSVPTRLTLENGRATIDAFSWNAEGNPIVATGSADLTGGRPSIDVALTGDLDLRVLSAFAPAIATAGTAHADLKAAGLFDSPDLAGTVTVAEGELQLDTPRLAATDLRGTLRIAEGRTVAIAMTGLVNTGATTIEGTVNLADMRAPQGRLHLSGRNIALEYPPGLQTESNASLELTLTPSSSSLSGRIDVLGGSYREALVLSRQLLNLSSANGIARAAVPDDDWVSRLRLDVTVASATDVHLDNNYGRLDVGGTLRITGTVATPGVIGRLQAADGGEIYLGGNTYRIERLDVDLANPRAIAPGIDFAAQTRIGDLPIGIELRCPAAAACERKVTSLSNGVDDKEAEARLFGTSGGAASAGESLARLLSGELLGVVGRTVGLDTIRLEQAADRRDIFDDPTLIAGDVDPAQRLTLAKRLGSSVELVYSQNLADDGFTWITNYFGAYGLSGRFLVFDDQSRSYEFRHEPPIGAGRRLAKPARGPRIVAVRISGSPGFPESDVRRQLRLGEGDRFVFGDWQRDRDRLARFYRERQFFEVRLRARRLPAERPDETVLEYVITRGPATQLIVRGLTLPDDVRERIAERWTAALFDGFLERDARTIVREHLFREGHLDASIGAKVTRDPSAEAKTLSIDVVPGPVVATRVEITGNAAWSSEQCLAIVAARDPLAPWLDPGAVERLLEGGYRTDGFLSADVSVSRPELRDGTSVVGIQVVEGPAFAVGSIVSTGAPAELERPVREALALASGERYRPAQVAAAIGRVETVLRRAAYRQAATEAETRVDAEAARVDIAVHITPGARSILRDVVVEGGDAASAAIARSITLATDAPLDPAALRETRQRLYDLDVYRSVAIDVQPVGAPAAPAAATGSEQPVVARITLGERPRYRFRYGLAVSDEEIGPDERDRRLGFAADLENRNVFGRALSAGLSLRIRSDQKVGRLTLGSKRLFGHPIRSTLFVERERETLNPDGAFPITADITSLTGEQAFRLRRLVEIRYGYGYEKNHTFLRTDSPDVFDITVEIARFTTSGLIDRRDDPFNPARGWFAASTLELSTPAIGSDLRFLKDFAQYSHFLPLGTGLVIASAVRLGLARTFEGEILIPSERFYAGGANSVRGYREDDLGARSVLDDAEGGAALLVMNGELRFPIYRWLKGVGFVDVGNVYPKVSDISLGDLRVGVGAGARFDTPVGLIRFDFGIPANPRPFDPRWRVHFGLGHAF